MLFFKLFSNLTVVQLRGCYKWRHTSRVEGVDTFNATTVLTSNNTFGNVSDKWKPFFADSILCFRRDLDFHICSGRVPIKNDMKILKEWSQNSSSTYKPAFMLKDQPLDGQGLYLQIVMALVILTSLQMWFYDRENIRTWIWKKIVKCLIIFKNPNKIQTMQVSSQSPNPKFHDTANYIIGNGHMLIIIVSEILSILPTVKVRFMATDDIKSILSGSGKIWYHSAKLVNATFHYLILPLLLISFNPAMRLAIKRNFLK